jgi:hypothetical protein
MRQIAQDLEAIDARMMEAMANTSPNGPPQLDFKVHSLMKGFSPGKATQVFLESPRAARWEECLKTGKFTLSIFDQLFEMGRELRSSSSDSSLVASAADTFSQVFQLSLLARLLTELQLRHFETQNQMVTNPDSREQKQWHLLREALEKSDQLSREKLKTLLVQAGVTPLEMAARVVSDRQIAGDAAAAALIEAIKFFDPAGSLWTLSDLSTLANPPAAPAKPAHLTGQAPRTLSAPRQEPAMLRLPQGSVIWEQSPIEKINVPAGSSGPGPQEEKDKQAAHGVTLTSKPQQKIPAGWIRCECPDDHPKAGMVFDGVRWHAPVLHCPNPDLKRWEVK